MYCPLKVSNMSLIHNCIKTRNCSSIYLGLCKVNAKTIQHQDLRKINVSQETEFKASKDLNKNSQIDTHILHPLINCEALLSGLSDFDLKVSFWVFMYS